MSTMQIVMAVAAVVLLIIFIMYNGLVKKRNAIALSFSSIDVMLKNRFDLIPNLIESVKQYVDHESSTFTKITEMRNQNYSTMSNGEKVQFDKSFAQCQTSLFAVAENYPDLKASDNFIMLQRSLNETEEQLAAARRGYNASVIDYNNSLETIPALWFAPAMGFKKNDNLLVTAENERENVSVKNLFNS